jgi:hypothetical protein
MNTFEDVATEQEDGEDVQDSYDKRTYELKKLFEVDIQSTLENIEESQLNQKHYQNNRMNVQDDTLSVGTRVNKGSENSTENVSQLQRNIHRSKFDTQRMENRRKSLQLCGKHGRITDKGD